MADVIATNRPARVVIVDDHALVGAGLVAVLSDATDGRFDVVGSVTRADEAAELVTSTHADLAIVDLHMPPPGGLEAIRQIAAVAPECKIVALSGEASLATIIEALAAGAAAFIPKTLGPNGLIAPLSTIISGGAVVPGAVIELLAGRWQETLAPPDTPELDEEATRLLDLLCRGLEVAAIAEELHVSASTVKRRVVALEARLGASSRAELAHLAGWHRLVAPHVEDAVSGDDQEKRESPAE